MHDSYVVEEIIKMSNEMARAEKITKQLKSIFDESISGLSINNVSLKQDREISFSRQIYRDSQKCIYLHSDIVPFYLFLWTDDIPSPISYVHINIRDTQYTTNDLLKMIHIFSKMKLLEELYLDGWDDICEKENTFDIIKENLFQLISIPDSKIIDFTFYMSNEQYNDHGFDIFSTPQIDFRIKDEEWD